MLFTSIQTLMFDPTPDITNLFGGFTIFLIIIPIITFIISLLIAIWVYKDAKKRDMNATVWLVIVFFTSCIGCIIYLVVRD